MLPIPHQYLVRLKIELKSYFYHYLFIGIFVLFAIVFAALPIVAAKFIAPKKPSPSKNASYECGLEAEGESWIQFRIQYYIYALVFVIFDIETIFLFPWAVQFKALGAFGLFEMGIFLAILIVGYIWVYKKGALDWI